MSTETLESSGIDIEYRDFEKNKKNGSQSEKVQRRHFSRHHHDIAGFRRKLATLASLSFLGALRAAPSEELPKRRQGDDSWRQTPRAETPGERRPSKIENGKDGAARTNPGKEKPGRREWLVAGFALMALVSSVVLLGALHVTGQFVVLTFSALAFAALFLPMFDEGRSQSAKDSWRKLVRFPLFWLGLALLALMLVQGLNPDYLVVTRAYSFRVHPMRPHVPWLPSGVSAPFELETAPGGMNAFRQMVMFGAPWLLLCALWVGVARRRVFFALGWGLMLFAFLFSTHGIWLRITGAQDFMGYHTLAEAAFFSTFPYQNNAGGWLSLAFAVACALGLRHWGRTADVRAPSGPHLLCAAFALSYALASICTLSFGGMLTTSALLFVATPAAILWLLWLKGVNRRAVLGGGVAVSLLALLVTVFFASMDLRSAQNKLERKFQLVETSRVDDRAPFRQATWDIITYRDNEHLWSGWGAGSYQWISPPFYKRLPAFQAKKSSPAKRSHHATCDWLEMLAEWGLLGMAIVVAAFAWVLGHLLRQWRRWTPATLVLVAAMLLYMGHSWMESLNYSMPVLCLAAFVTMLAMKFSLSSRSGKSGGHGHLPYSSFSSTFRDNSNGGNLHSQRQKKDRIQARDDGAEAAGHSTGHHRHHSHHAHHSYSRRSRHSSRSHPQAGSHAPEADQAGEDPLSI
ncbi:MAG: O-antigen ligase family protein [Puniceicoccales bacterium]|jgi:O-antigen ligase|nr:O-antigen ligase family protein [Puniceicoccales bacterium]